MTKFKYGEEVRILARGFFQWAIGQVIDCRDSEYRNQDSDTFEKEYLVKLQYNQIWVLENALGRVNQ